VLIAAILLVVLVGLVAGDIALVRAVKRRRDASRWARGRVRAVGPRDLGALAIS